VNQSIEQLASDVSNALDRAKYYGEAPTLETLREIDTLVSELNSDEIYDQECLDAEYSRGFDDGKSETEDERDKIEDKLNDEIEHLKLEINNLQGKLADLQATPKRGKRKDPFKGRTPEQMRRTLQVIRGAMDEYET
jgi:hypothetical protein